MAVNMGQHHVSPRSLSHLTDHIRRASGYGADQSRGRHQGRAVPQCRIDLLDWGCRKLRRTRGICRVAAIASIVWSAWPYTVSASGLAPATPAPCPAQLRRAPVGSGVVPLCGRMPPAPAPPCRAAHARRAPRLRRPGAMCLRRVALRGQGQRLRGGSPGGIMLSPDQRQFPHPRSRGMCQRQRIQMSASRSAVARRKHASARLSSPRRRYARPAFPGHAPAPPTRGSIAAPARRLRGCVGALRRARRARDRGRRWCSARGQSSTGPPPWPHSR